MGKTIYKMIISQQGEREKSKKIVFVIMTDGLENASCEYTYLTVKRLIENQKKIGWEFFFLGANVDAVREAANIGISSDRSVTFHNNSAGIALNYEVIGETWDNFVTVFLEKKKLRHSLGRLSHSDFVQSEFGYNTGHVVTEGI